MRANFRILKDTSLLSKLSAGFIVVDARPVVPGVKNQTVKQTYDDSICYAGTALTAGTGFFTSLKKPKWFSVQVFWAI